MPTPGAAGARKPDPVHVWKTIEEMNGDRESTLFVGDMPIDILAARSAAIPVATIATGSATTEELVAHHPDYMLRRLSELLPLVQGAVER